VDAFLEIDTWKNVDRLMKSCNLAVVSRGEFEFSSLNPAIKNLSEKFKEFRFHYEEIEPESGLSCIKEGSTHCHIIPVVTRPVEISSTTIREKVKSGQTIKGLAPEKVEIYIEKNRFYS
jgi:nicotinate-nucleotide adenylyltransferase